MLGIGCVMANSDLIEAELLQKPQQIFTVNPTGFRLHAAAKGLFLVFQIRPLMELDWTPVPIAYFGFAKGCEPRIAGTQRNRVDNMGPQVQPVRASGEKFKRADRI